MMQAKMGNLEIPTDSVVERVYERLKAMAIAYEFKPGERLNEVELSRSLGARRTPLREALNRLSRSTGMPASCRSPNGSAATPGQNPPGDGGRRASNSYRLPPGRTPPRPPPGPPRNEPRPNARGANAERVACALTVEITYTGRTEYM